MLIPLGHEKTTVRRLPWVTFGIMAVCLMVHLLVSLTWRDGEQQLVENLDEAFRFFLEHPYLELEHDFQDLVAQNVPEEEFAALLEAARQMGPKPPDDASRLARQQENLDRLTSTALEALRSTPFHDWGLIPAALKPHSVVTHMFVHGGWLHLIGNLFILFLAGPFVEDVWGRPVFLSFYLVGGAFAGLLYALRYPDLAGPLIGASGAVAAVMGAFLVRFFNAKIRFFYWFIIFVGTFSAPAWLMLPLWFARELFFAQAMDVVAPGGGGGGVAYWAHVWGFAFGAAVECGFRRFGFEERFIDRVIESKITVVDNRTIEEALDLRSEGREEEAFRLLSQAVEQDPDNIDAVTALWNLSVDLGKAGLVGSRMVHIVKSAARSREDELVRAQWGELIREITDLRVEPALTLKVAEVFRDSGDNVVAIDALDRAALVADSTTPPGVAVRLARLAVDLGASSAASLLATAVGHPDLPEAARTELEGLKATTLVAGELEPPIEASSISTEKGESVELSEMPRHELQVMNLTPQSLAATGIVLVAGESRRTLAFEHILAVAVGGVKSIDGRAPFLLVDLLLDPPYGWQPKLRVVRLDGTTYDPRKIVGGEEALAAFRTMIERLLDASEAIPLPDPGAARGRPFQMYDSVEDYEQQVLAST